VLGRYHPHGDAAVYQTMVRMAQSFSLRYPLIEGHGNFGNVDGDGAAAYRYTEARMSKLADQMMADIEKLRLELPGIDCGSCGAPSYRALAEDIVKGESTIDACVIRRFRLEQEQQKASEEDAKNDERP
jgi:hypothetical protein